jgi:membrane protein implicated in regulation of membrane protease activity
MISFFTISTHHLKLIRVVIEFIITIFFIAFFIIFFIAIIASIIILNYVLWQIKIELINSIIKLKSILFDVFE